MFIKIQLLGDEYPSLIESLVNIQNKIASLEENVAVLKESLDEAYRNLMDSRTMTMDGDTSFEAGFNNNRESRQLAEFDQLHA